MADLETTETVEEPTRAVDDEETLEVEAGPSEGADEDVAAEDVSVEEVPGDEVTLEVEAGPSEGADEDVAAEDVSVEEVSADDAAAEEVSAEGVPVEDVPPAPVDPAATDSTPDAEEPAQSESEDAEALLAKAASPYDLPGDWYVIHSYSGYENKVKANLETRIQSMHMEDRIFEVHIPMEDVVEFKGGKKVTVPKKVFPGYILVRMTLDDDSWYAVRNTPGVTGFVAGNAQKPTPLSRREVERFLGVQEEEEKGKPRFKPEWDVGEQVRVVTGPFADFNGTIEELNVDQQKVVVLVNIFGRDTPVELGFEDIQKN